MSDTSVLLSGIEYKLRKLIAANVRLRTLVDSQEKELLRLRQENVQLKEENSILTEKIEIKTIADTFSNKSEIEEGRKRIQALMQSIEQSIALINK